MKIIDLFSGVGGLSLGFEKAGFEVVAAVDNWADAIETFNFNHKNKVGIVADVGDFNQNILNNIIRTNKISGVVGGPPCQGYSSARLSDRSERIDGINESRNKLYLDFYSTVKISKPDFFVLENVRGMVTLDKGAFVKDVFQRFGKLGYSIEMKILNASDFGVPQIRKRVFFVGIKGKNRFSFPEPKFDYISTFEALSDLPEPSSEEFLKYSKAAQSKYQTKIRKASKGIFNHQQTNHSAQTVNVINLVPDGGNIRSLPENFMNLRNFNKAFQRMNSMKPSLTIDTGHRNYFHYSENRIPTVRESARIQSFPDWFKFLGSKTSQYKQVGNAVPPELALQLAKAIKSQVFGG
jgi:DNA (cytosine-5)-methyltransferase 1